jgi:molybdopterin-synthase adenylyltransferase
LWSFNFNEFFKQVCKANLLTHACIVDSKSSSKNRYSIYAFKGCICLEDQEVELLIGLDKHFPLSLPKIFLNPFDKLGFIPHLDKDGFVCYVPEEGLLDSDNPLGIIRDALLKVKKTLLDGMRGTNHLDFIDEFETYWRQLENIKRLESFIELTDEPQDIIAKKDSKGKYVAITSSDAIIHQYDKNHKQFTSCKAIYLPLKSEAKIFPPHFSSIWSLEELRKIVLQNISDKSISFLENKSKGKIKREEIIILSQTRPSGDMSVFGLLFKGVESGYPLICRFKC